MSDGRQWVVQLVEGHPEDRSFDLEFWQAVEPEQRWAAAWQMIVDAHAIRGANADQLRVQRTLISTRPA